MNTVRNRCITAGGEQGVHESTSDSEYDSDVIVVGKGRKCPRISETPPNHALSEMRNILAPPTLLLPIPPEIPEPGPLEWYPVVTEQSCPRAAEISELKSRVAYLEAFRNIELHSEIHEDYCQLALEVQELRRSVKDLTQQKKVEDIRRKLEGEKRRELDNLINSRISSAEVYVRDHILQMRDKLKTELRRIQIYDGPEFSGRRVNK
jgi:hypothetical protein